VVLGKDSELLSVVDCQLSENFYYVFAVTTPSDISLINKVILHGSAGVSGDGELSDCEIRASLIYSINNLTLIIEDSRYFFFCVCIFN
jgi:hypothetical protein